MGIIGLVELDGRLSERAIRYFEARVKGGVGLIITGACLVESEVEPKLLDSWSLLVRVDSVMYVSRLSELADIVHDYGAKIAVQMVQIDHGAASDHAPYHLPSTTWKLAS